MPRAPNLSFRCELCQKSYARSSELSTHELSYDHHHRKRAQDLRIASRDSYQRDREREKEKERSGLIAIPHETPVGSQKKVKRGFKSAFGANPDRDTFISHPKLPPVPQKFTTQSLATPVTGEKDSKTSKIPAKVESV